MGTKAELCMKIKRLDVYPTENNIKNSALGSSYHKT